MPAIGSLELKVERAVPDADGNRLFTSNAFINFRADDADVDSANVKFFWAIIKDATKNAPGHGSIIAYHIRGGWVNAVLNGHTIANQQSTDEVSGMALPIDIISNDVPTKTRVADINNLAYLSRGWDDPYYTIRIATTKNAIGVSNSDDLLKVQPMDNSDSEINSYNYDDGTILFDNFIVYGTFGFR